MLFYDWTLIMLIPGILIVLFAQIAVSTTFNKYKKVNSNQGRTAVAIARELLDKAGLNNVAIEQINGELVDHYDPRTRVLRLSQSVADSTSVAAIGVAAHEAGHAMQHGQGYLPLCIRNIIAPVVSFVSFIAIPLVIIALLLEYFQLANIALMMYAGVIIFQLITLPVEFNASRRAVFLLESGGYLNYDEIKGAKRVLNAAAFTYIASTLLSLLQFLRLFLLVSGSRRRD